MDLHTLFATPAIYVPGENWEEEVEKMLLRSLATDKFLAGEMDAETFCDLLDEHQIDVKDLVTAWEEDDLVLI